MEVANTFGSFSIDELGAAEAFYCDALRMEVSTDIEQAVDKLGGRSPAGHSRRYAAPKVPETHK